MLCSYVTGRVVAGGIHLPRDSEAWWLKKPRVKDHTEIHVFPLLVLYQCICSVGFISPQIRLILTVNNIV